MGRVLRLLNILILSCGLAFAGETPDSPKPSSPPVIQKLGTLDCDLVETTPVVFRDRLYRFEYIRENYAANQTGKSYFHFVDVESGQTTPPFAAGFHLGCAFVDRDTMYVYGVETWGAGKIQVFWSTDFNHWQTAVALDLPGWQIFNQSVCAASGRFVMAFEIGAPPDETGVAFTTRFAESTDLIHWQLTPSSCVYTRERYSACPSLRFLDGLFYMTYLESRPGPTYETHLVRSSDLQHWESSRFNPILKFSDDDKKISNPRLTDSQRARIEKAVDINNSDVDFCEFQGKVILYYSWGNQQGVEHLAEAVYPGTLKNFLQGYFP